MVARAKLYGLTPTFRLLPGNLPRMKTSRGLTANRSPRVNMRIRILALLALSSLAGCHRKEVEVSNQSQNSADIGTPLKTASDGKPEALPPPPPKVAATADNYVRQNVNGLVDPKLTAQLRDFVQKYGRLPLSFRSEER